MNKRSPALYIIAGPNGAGKTTFAREFLPRYAQCRNFINADLIAGGLAPFSPETAALHAGRLLLQQIHAFSKKKDDFGFETTLSGITYLALLKELKKQGYTVHLSFLWLPTPDLAAARVSDRVQRGGHAIPEPVIRRRFYRGIANFSRHYAALADTWILFDNSAAEPKVVARRTRSVIEVKNRTLFNRILKMGESHA